MRCLHVYHRHGYPYRVVTDDPALADFVVCFIADDEPDRLMLVAAAVGAELTRMLSERNACRVNTQRHGVGIACEAALERCQAAAQQISAQFTNVIQELCALSRDGDTDPVDLANAARDAVARLDADLLRRLQQQLADDCEAALELRVSDFAHAAHDGDHQQPLIDNEGNDHVRH